MSDKLPTFSDFRPYGSVLGFFFCLKYISAPYLTKQFVPFLAYPAAEESPGEGARAPAGNGRFLFTPVPKGGLNRLSGAAGGLGSARRGACAEGAGGGACAAAAGPGAAA